MKIFRKSVKQVSERVMLGAEDSTCGTLLTTIRERVDRCSFKLVKRVENPSETIEQRMRVIEHRWRGIHISAKSKGISVGHVVLDELMSLLWCEERPVLQDVSRSELSNE